MPSMINTENVCIASLPRATYSGQPFAMRIKFVSASTDQVGPVLSTPLTPDHEETCNKRCSPSKRIGTEASSHRSRQRISTQGYVHPYTCPGYADKVSGALSTPWLGSAHQLLSLIHQDEKCTETRVIRGAEARTGRGVPPIGTLNSWPAAGNACAITPGQRTCRQSKNLESGFQRII